MIRFRTASGEIVSPGGDPNVKKGMVPTPPLKGGITTFPPHHAPPDIARLEAELKAAVAQAALKVARIKELEAERDKLLADLDRLIRAEAVSVVSNASSNAQSNAPFDKTAYQRDLMRDRRAAKRLGITVAAYRALPPGGKP